MSILIENDNYLIENYNYLIENNYYLIKNDELYQEQRFISKIMSFPTIFD